MGDAVKEVTMVVNPSPYELGQNPFKYGYVCIYIYIYVYIYIYYVYTHMYRYVYIYINIIMYVYIYIYGQIDLHNYVYVDEHIYIYIHFSIHIHITLALHFQEGIPESQKKQNKSSRQHHCLVRLIPRIRKGIALDDRMVDPMTALKLAPKSES